MITTQPEGTTPKTSPAISQAAKRNVKSILWNKFLDILESSTFRQIISVILLVITSLILTLVLTYAKETSAAILQICRFNNYIFPKAIGSFLIVFNFRNIVDLLKAAIPEFPVNVQPTGETIEGIPVIELLDHLFEFESFKRDDIEKKFGIPRNRFTTLAQKLEDLCVLKRGENNSRILNEEFARSDVALLLEGKTSAADLRLVHRKVDDCTWTYAPAGQTMKEKVKELLTQKKEEVDTPSLGFTIRKLDSVE